MSKSEFDINNLKRIIKLGIFKETIPGEFECEELHATTVEKHKYTYNKNGIYDKNNDKTYKDLADFLQNKVIPNKIYKNPLKMLVVDKILKAKGMLRPSFEADNKEDRKAIVFSKPYIERTSYLDDSLQRNFRNQSSEDIIL